VVDGIPTVTATASRHVKAMNARLHQKQAAVKKAAQGARPVNNKLH